MHFLPLHRTIDSMKSQYFGDVNDYRKYGLLRTLVRGSLLRVGVCWFLTPDDDGRDGERRRYLNQPHQWRHYDPELFDMLQRLLLAHVPRSVSLAREWDLLPSASYFEALVSDTRSAREKYLVEAQHAVHECDLVFVDPDNGIEAQSTKIGRSGSSKYVYWSELKALYESGHSLLIYQQFPRVVRERFVPFLGARLGEELPASTVFAFSTAHVVFFLVRQPRHADALDTAARVVEQRWRGQIDVWSDGTDLTA